MNKKKGIIIGAFALVITMVVGYALFGKNIEIKGTATASGNFDLSYICNVEEIGGTGSYEIVDNKITTTSTLTKPGDGIIYTIKVTNNGTIPAVLTTIDSPNNVTMEDPNAAGDEAYFDKTNMLLALYQVELENGEAGNEKIGDSAVEAANFTLQPGQSIIMTIQHMWGDSEILGITQPKLPEGGATINYDITLGFVQTTN